MPVLESDLKNLEAAGFHEPDRIRITEQQRAVAGNRTRLAFQLKAGRDRADAADAGGGRRSRFNGHRQEMLASYS
jgi:hypothetical protein